MASLFERLKSDCADDWRDYTHHEFVESLGRGDLPSAAFQDYLVQDFLFLIQFARAYALSIYKSRSLAEMRGGLDGLKAIMDVEMDLHIRMCDRWGLDAVDLEKVPEKSQTVAYTRFALDAGNAGDLLDLYVALAPCMIGYGEIGARLADQQGDDNTYAEWINEYASPEYQELVSATIANLDELAAVMMTEARYPQLKLLFAAATRLESDFWQMGLDAAASEA
ncbi:MAG: thiaminase II [Rhizobiaceae bacterium]|nr:thiaminase II [Rhizobiaceae bacterium]